MMKFDFIGFRFLLLVHGDLNKLIFFLIVMDIWFSSYIYGFFNFRCLFIQDDMVKLDIFEFGKRLYIFASYFTYEQLP